jgi:hypothetical protein
VITDRQVIWLGSRETTFAAICELCLAEPDPLGALAYRMAKVDGSLRPEADVGFVRCRRGHRLCVRRTSRAPLLASA